MCQQQGYPLQLECEICFHVQTQFFIVCPNQHSFCFSCSERLLSTCPKCRQLLYTDPETDKPRNRFIQEFLKYFYQTLRQDRTLQKNVDVYDCDGHWCLAKIVDFKQTSFKVHYYGWADHWDEWIDDGSERIMPAYSFTEDWFSNIHVGQVIEFLLKKNNKRRWYMGFIIGICPSGKNVLVAREANTEHKIKIQLDREHLTPIGTHIPIKHNASIS